MLLGLFMHAPIDPKILSFSVAHKISLEECLSCLFVTRGCQIPKKKKPNELNHSKDMYMGHMKPNESV